MDSDDGFRFPLGTPIVIYPLLAMGAASQRWGSVFAVIAVLFAAAFTWEAMSRKEFESVRAKDPTMNIQTWRFNWLVFFAVPGYAIGLYRLWKIL